MEAQKKITEKGGTMRLGAWKCDLIEDTKIASIYNTTPLWSVTDTVMSLITTTKHNLKRRDESHGFNPDTGLVEIIEIPSHPWFVGFSTTPNIKVQWPIHIRYFWHL